MVNLGIFKAKKIRSKLLFWFLIISIVPLSIISIVEYANLHKLLKERNLREFYQIAAIKNRQFLSFFSEQERHVHNLTHNVSITEALEQSENLINKYGLKSIQYRQEEIKSKKILQNYATDYEFSDLLLINLQGQIVSSLRNNDDLYSKLKSGEGKGSNPADLFKIAMERNEVKLSAYWSHQGAGIPTTILVAPIEQGHIVKGALVAQLKIDVLFKSIQDYSTLGKTGEVLIGERKGNEVVFISPLRFGKDSVFDRTVKIGSGKALPIQYATSGKIGKGISTDYRNNKVFSVWKYIPKIGWGIVVKKDIKEIYSSVYQMRMLVLIFGLFFVLVIVILANYLASSLSKPVMDLQLAVQKVGKGDLNHEVASTSSDEFGMLSQSFNTMLRNLKEVTASRDELNEEIRQRKQAQEENKLLLRAIEENPSVVIITDKAGVITYVNQKFELETGYNTQEAIGQKPQIIGSGLMSPLFYKEMWSNLLNRKEWKGEIQNKKKNGELFWQAVYISPILNDVGEITHFVSVQQNISEKKKMIEALEVNARQLEKSRKAALNLMQDANNQKLLAEKALQSLEESQAETQKFADIVNSSEAIIIGENLEGIVQSWNKGAERIYGYSPEEIIGKPISILLPKDAAEKAPLLIEKIKNGEIVERYESRHVRKDRELIDISLKLSPIKDLKNNLVGISIIGQDISDRKIAERALKRSEEKTRLLLNSAAEAIYGIDLNGNCTFLNKSCLSMLGYEYDEDLIGKNIHALIHHKYADGTPLPAEKCRIYMAYKQGAGTHADDEVLWKADGSSFPVEYWSYPQKLDGKTVGAVVTFFDITERKQVEESLKRSEETFRLAISATEEGIWDWDIINNTEFFSPRWCEIIGYSDDDPELSHTFDSWLSRVHPDDHDYVMQALKDHLEKGKEYKVEYRHRHKSGEYRWQSSVGNAVRNEEGTPVRMVGCISDITERKKYEAEIKIARDKAEEATRAKSLFLANMSHEIRTPMNAILGFAEILSRRVSDPVQKDYLHSMQGSGKALLSLINDLLDLSKAEAGKLELYAQTTDIRYLIHDVESIFRLEAHKKNLDLIVSIADSLPVNLFLDEMKIRQVLLNLCSNAIKFTEKGFVKISVKAENIGKETADLLIQVQDSGKGVDPEFHDKIFNLFEQQDAAISRHYGGTGLGLAISQQIVHLMNGHIELKSEVDKGSIFTVHIPGVPLSHEKAEMRPLKELVPGSLIFEPATLLIVDDTPSNILVLNGILEEFPFDILKAEDGQQALALMDKNKIDLVFMDIRMPVMDGMEAIRIIREHPEWSHIPVIALTASVNEYKEKHFKQKGFNAFVRKPATTKTLMAVLGRFLKYKLREKEATKELKFSAKTMARFPEMMADIECRLIPLQQSLMGIRPRKKVKEMGELLIDIGTTYHAEGVKHYGEEILSTHENFQLEKEKELITNFTNYLGQLNSKYHEYKSTK